MSKRFIHLTNTLLFTESPGCFDLFQTFHASEGMAVTSFEIKGELFVTFSNYKHTPSRFKRKLLVYVLQKNNSFTYNQTLDSFYVQEIEYFTIHGDHFLVAANEYNGWSYRLASVVYRWEAGKFKEFQRIPTAGVKSAHYFTINTRKLISFIVTPCSAFTRCPFTNGKMINLVIRYKTFKCETQGDVTLFPFTTSLISRVAEDILPKQSQLWNGQEKGLNHFRIFARRLSWAAHTSSRLTVPFILLSRTYGNLATTVTWI